MIIACPNCQTKYNLPDEKIPPGGRKVKCSKCQHTFKATPPPPTPEEQVEVLLDEERVAPRTTTPDSSSEFEDAFQEAVASGEEGSEDKDLDEAFGPPGVRSSREVVDEEDLFGDDAGAAADSEAQEDVQEEEPEETSEKTFEDGIEEDSEGTPEEEQEEKREEQEEETPEESFLGDDDEFLSQEEEAEVGEDIFSSAEEEAEEADEFSSPEGEAEVERLFSLGDDDGFSLDDTPKKSKKKKTKGGKKKGHPVLLVLLILFLALAAVIVTFNLGLWNEKDFMKDPPSFELPFELPVKVPFLHGPQAQGPSEPGQSPTERIKYIQPVDFRQYIITNEKAGPIFVVEGKALNKFTSPKERIKVMVTLFDGEGNVLTSAEQLCGNTLSLFQLQVQSEQEIMDALDSQAGIYANNTYIKPGETTPFMVVFFNPPDAVEEYQIKIVDARDPAQ